ncbi:DUF3375 family protein [Luteipulveratus mongoliensis]|uniref:DUF3375 domain-containing protein n=1 Tax=Luteipulveratus mongoliensis TaxID=571913 RepID=A0A0K1JE50_9MICO|nr:DUF3375 family protein [Luteipulveratus mongoliensis]AKU14868.1 hypothetical protein VV02_01630 [Luteipulveratus mongoliensis]
MSDPVARFREAEGALNNKTVSLFRQPVWGPLVLATLMDAFEAGRQEIPAEQFHVRAAHAFDAIREQSSSFPEGLDDPKAVRDRCKSWVGDGWMERHLLNGTEVYRLTAVAREAIAICRQLSSTRAAMSESQVRVVLDRAQALAVKATSDSAARQRSLRDEIARLEYETTKRQAELARLEAGGAVETVDDEEVLNEYLILRDDIDRIPSDLKRVEESFSAMAHNIREDFLTETRSHGEVLGEYLQRANNLVVADRYGRGFEQAKRMLSDPHLRTELARHLQTIMEHPFAEVLADRERSELQQTVNMIAESVSAVFAQRREMTKRLTSYLTAHDASRERELDDALRGAQGALQKWSAEHGMRDRLRLPVGFTRTDGDDPDEPVCSIGEVSTADVATMRERAVGKPARTGLTPLSAATGSGGTPISLEDVRSKGGPFYTELAAAVEIATSSGGAAAGADIYNRLPSRTRRPVDLLGMLAMAAQEGAFDWDLPLEEYYAIRPDGTEQTFLAPSLTFVAQGADT